MERKPPHYHVAVFPNPYSRYVARIAASATRSAELNDVRDVTVGRRDTLWRIARRHGTTPEAIQRANGLSSTLIHPGQVLKVPVANDEP